MTCESIWRKSRPGEKEWYVSRKMAPINIFEYRFKATGSDEPYLLVRRIEIGQVVTLELLPVMESRPDLYSWPVNRWLS